jgi:hypothetical protein
MSDLQNRLVIDDSNYLNQLSPYVDGAQVMRGLVPRDYSQNPRGCYASSDPKDIPLIPRSDWPELIREMTEKKTRLSDIRRVGNYGQHIPALDQNGQGYCWAYSTTAAVQILRAASNMPYVPLSAHSVACVIKNFRDQGGWGALSLDYIREHGVVPQSLWPAKSMDRRYNTPENWAEAKKYRVTEGWYDLSESVYDRDLTFDQTMSLLLSRVPVVLDFYWWGHSVCGFDPIDFGNQYSLNDPERWGIDIMNSWRDAWGNLGMGIVRGRKAIPDGAVAPRYVLVA